HFITLYFCNLPGMSIFGKQRCRCNGRLVNGLDPKSITRFGVFPPGSICDKVDIIVTMKSRKQICNGDKPQAWGVPQGRSPRRAIFLGGAKFKRNLNH
uniref:Chemokine interleukin-8-like domain-containing protein n=1 Tax=Leptobrachium leishanense TaxID=445787 RepID=A0A8C5PEQ0_9ANUR